MTLVDTNIFIEVFKGNAEVLQTLETIGLKNICLSSVTAMELYYGALNKLELQRIYTTLTVILNEVKDLLLILIVIKAKSRSFVPQDDTCFRIIPVSYSVQIEESFLSF